MTIALMPPARLESAIKVAESLASNDFMCVWEGAVRSGKTVIALVAFAEYVVNSPGTTFLMSGRTIKTIEKNAILEDFGILKLLGLSIDAYHRVGEERAIVFTAKGVEKKISVAGASDIRAYMAIRGNTYDGWFADEINMHDREFVSEAMRRTAVSECRRHFWTLNPDNPHHWIYERYIDFYDRKAPEEKDLAGGFSLFTFYPRDNPAMTDAAYEALKAQYAEGSMEYRRYILGERCIAEGLVYPYIDECVEEPPPGIRIRYAGIDFGTVHPTAMGWYGRDDTTGVWFKVKEWVATEDESRSMTTDLYMDVFESITRELGGIPRSNLTIDYGGGGEALVREAERRRWFPQNPNKSVLDGISILGRLLRTGKLRISPSCRKSIKALSLYHWDDKVSERGGTAPCKVMDDPVDETRYVAVTFIDPRVR